jgi:membrane-bound lytic murein transglycosylase D
MRVVNLKISIILILFSVFTSGNELGYSSPDIFPLHEDMIDTYQFWIKIFTQYNTNEYVIHDSRNMSIIYEVVTWGALDESKMDEPQTREQKQFFKEKIKYYKRILGDLAAVYPDTNKLNKEQQRVYRLLTAFDSKNDFYDAMHRIRIQKGQKNRFRQGLEISGRYMPFLKRIFNKYNLPEELTLMPHVESSFNYKAYSSAGAAGIWQFTRGTGKRYLKISYEVDERLDPIMATEAAARLLKQNYEALGTWPLAITAYNHGLQGMKRAVKKLKTKNLNTIIKKYKSRYFKFASRNFYCEFVAVVHIVQNYELYFEAVEFESPLQFNEFFLPNYMKYATLSAYLGIDDNLFRIYNPALRPSVYNNSKYIPKGYRLRLPANVSADSLIAVIPGKAYYPEQKRSKYYHIRYGDTLSEIARKFGTSVEMLLAMNNISNEHYIRRGMTIRIPDEKEESVILANNDNKQISTNMQSNAQSSESEKILASDSNVQRDHTMHDNTMTAGNLASVFTNGKSMADLEIEFIQTQSPPIGYIRVEPEETLGHYAEWLQIKTQRIRDWNKLSFGKAINLNQKIKLIFDQVAPAAFNRMRLEYHRGIEEDFFMHYEIIGTLTHQVQTGENLWYLCHYIYNLPYWLIVAYNKDTDFNQLKPGDQLIIPDIKTKDDVTI